MSAKDADNYMTRMLPVYSQGQYFDIYTIRVLWVTVNYKTLCQQNVSEEYTEEQGIWLLETLDTH